MLLYIGGVFMKIHKKILSLVIVAIMCITILPVMPENVKAATSTFDFSAIDNWNVTTKFTHATFTTSGNGVKITQTKQTRYKADGVTNNSNWDGSVAIGLYQDLSSGADSAVKTQGFSGNVKLTLKYKVKNDNTAGGSAFYHLTIPGFAYIRIHEGSIKVLNNSSAGNSDVTNSSLNSYASGNENTMVINIDTVNDKFTVQLNGGSKIASGASANVNSGKAGKGFVDGFNISSMERMAKDSYLDISSVTVEADTGNTVNLSEETKAIVASFPKTLVDDPDNVTTNVTLPWDIPGIKWKSSDHNVMNQFGIIQRKSASDPTYVEIFCDLEGTTADGKLITLRPSYKMNVTGLSNRVDVSATINPSSNPDAEKWYTMPQRGEIEDGYPIFDDPMFISDEAFFGKWNATKGSWELKPYFRYADFPDMAKVETAAKAGNYETAKAELKAYYMRHFDEKATKQTSISATNLEYYKLKYEFISRNTYPVSNICDPINMFTIPKNKSEITVDVTRRLNEALGTFTCFSTMIASIDKYKNQAMIYSKESSTPPVLVVTLSDGTTHECPAIKDSYIQAGSYSKTNYGSETVLLAEESGVHRNHDDRTKRAYIGFDISGIKKGSKATNAYVKFTANHNGSDAEKLMILYWHSDSSWQEEYVCFDTFSEHFYFSANDMMCWDYVTSNSTSVKGKTCSYHRGDELGSLANLYSYMEYLKDSGKTDNAAYDPDYEKYGYTTIRQNMALINSVGVEPDIFNSLDNSCHIIHFAQDVFRLINSPYMTPDRFTAMLKYLWLAADYKNYNEYGVHYNNWATFSTGAVYAMCARYPEFVRYNDWLETTRAENERVTNGFVFEDGMSLELSQGYTGTILDTFESPYALMNAFGSESPYNEKTENVIYNLVMSIFNQSAPGGGGFGFGDSTNPYSTQKSTFTTWYNNLFEGNPIIAYMGSGGSKGWLPENATTNYPVGLRTFMREDWSADAVAMGFTNKAVGSHGHKDALSVSMYAYGKFLLVDPGYGAVLTGNIRNYMISPQQHNILTVNDYKNYLDPETNAIDSTIKTATATLQSKDGKEECFDSNLHYDFIEYSTDAYTTSQKAQRSVTFLKDAKMYIITDYVIPNDGTTENVYTQNWHLYPGSNMTFDENKIVRSNFENEPNIMLVPVKPDEIDEVTKVKTLYSERSGQFIDSHKAVYKKTKNDASTTTFSTIVVPMNVGEDFDVTTTPIKTTYDENQVNAFKFTVTNKVTDESRNFIYYHLNDASLKDVVKIGGYETDAQTLLVEQYDTGFIKSVYMVNGTYVSKNGNLIMQTKEETSAAFALNDKVLDYSVKDGDASSLNDVTFSSALANKVVYDGEEYEFTVTDGKITFDGVVAPEEPTVDPHAGTLIYDSAVNPELLQVYIPEHAYYKATNMGKDGIKFENIVSVPYKSNGSVNGTSRAVGRIRFNRIIEDAENQTKTTTNLMSGVYAVEMTLQQNITTERMENGSIKSTFATLDFGTSNDALTSAVNSFINSRLYTNTLNIIRTAGTQKDYIRLDVSNVGLQSFKPDEEWKLRVVFDTINKTYTMFVDDAVEPKAMSFPYDVVSKSTDGVVTWTEKPGTYLPDFQLTFMDASSVGSYVWIKNVKIYEIEKAEDDRFNLMNALPLKLYAGNPSLVDGSLNVPAINGVTWASGNTSIFDVTGKLLTKVKEPTPITFTATGTVADTEVANRTFTFTRTYGMTVVSPSSWTLSATNTGKTVKASVSSMNENYGLQPALIIVGYNSKGAICDKHIKPVTEKLVDYEYTLNSETVTTKVFLLDTLNTAVPLAPHKIFN